MQVADLPEVLQIERASFSNPWSAALFLQELQVPFSRILVVRPAGEVQPIVGYLCRWYVADEVHILNVAVRPEYRQQGVAALLMGEVLQEARRGKAIGVTLEVRRSNAAARALYGGLGFEEVGVRRDYYGRGEDALIMRLDVTQG